MDGLERKNEQTCRQPPSVDPAKGAGRVDALMTYPAIDWPRVGSCWGERGLLLVEACVHASGDAELFHPKVKG
jgi:hypothetical protein